MPEPIEKHKCVKCQKEFECEGYPRCFGSANHHTICQDCYAKQIEKNRRLEYLKSAGIPTNYEKIDSEKTNLIEEALNSDKGIFCYGPSGTGKTTLLVTIIKKLILEKGQECKFINSIEFIMGLQSMYRNSDQDPFSYIKRIAAIPVLLIDDIGAEKITDFVKQSFYFLVNEREQWQRRTFISSNYSLKELNDKIDFRIASRISGMCEIIKLEGQDLRVKK